MTKDPPKLTATLWAHVRFAIVGALLSAPPARGELKKEIRALAAKIWTHPISGDQVQFSAVTIERWYYLARRAKEDPVGVLRRAVRKDKGRVSLPAKLAERLLAQYRQYKHWSYQLHYDNLKALVDGDPELGRLPSYSTVRRYMQAHGLLRVRRRRHMSHASEGRAVQPAEPREVRSYEVEYVGGLWHLDFHYVSLKVVDRRGRWQRAIVLGILDDHSRLCCHLQCYLSETTEVLVHGLSQAIQKRGLPRAVMSDNGSAMLAEEFTEGLQRLGIVHQRTLTYAPHQNGKQECFWSQLEGRLLQMLGGVADLTLDFLNQAMQAWVEIEYNRAVHRETGSSPVQRFGQSPDVLRRSPSSEELRDAFRREVCRNQRRSDGTISLEGQRFEIPRRYRHFPKVTVRYARWDLGRVDLVDPNSGMILTRIYPLDRTANADGRRSLVEPAPSDVLPDDNQPGSTGLPPLLQRYLEEFSATGMPPAYLPQNPPAQEEDEDQDDDKAETEGEQA
jgi:transposase InsO family protein